MAGLFTLGAAGSFAGFPRTACTLVIIIHCINVNKLLNYKNSYAEIDARYNTVKTERKAAKKQIKYAEKKIKNLDNAKKKIRKNFQRNMNI